ncbi:MAG: luciferase family protein [Hyphomicrobiaceae bacterium]
MQKGMEYRSLKTRFWIVFTAATLSCGIAAAETISIPQRALPPPQTTSGVPHIQLGVKAVPQVDAELLRRVSALPSVEVRPTVVSLPGAKGFWLRDEIPLAHPEVIAGGREFAHVHPDGSLHASLPPNRALEAVQTGWAVRHPWADKRRGWEGFVMLYTPQSMEELDVTFQLIVDSYNFVTGKTVRAEDY